MVLKTSMFYIERKKCSKFFKISLIKHCGTFEQVLQTNDRKSNTIILVPNVDTDVAK